MIERLDAGASWRIDFFFEASEASPLPQSDEARVQLIYSPSQETSPEAPNV